MFAAIALPVFAWSILNVLREMLHRQSAIVLEPEKMYLVESRLSPIVRDMGLDSIEELVEELRVSSLSPNGAQQRVVEAMTTNETSFFRDIHPFEALRQSVLPELIQRRQADRTLNLWCAAASSGMLPITKIMM